MGKQLIMENNMSNHKSKKAKLLFESANFNETNLIIENSIGGIGKNYYIEGIFSEADSRNQNGRLYPERILTPEIERFVEKYVKTDRALMQCDHPESSSIKLDRVGGRIIKLEKYDKKWYGKAIIGGPKGDAIKKIMDIGGCLGVSSRALGNYDMNNIVTELQIITWDIVHDPSVATAMMRTLVEGKEYDWITDDNYLFADKLEKNFKIINKNSLLTKKEKELYIEMLYKSFLNKLLK
jgi:hypothetical protein